MDTLTPIARIAKWIATGEARAARPAGDLACDECDELVPAGTGEWVPVHRVALHEGECVIRHLGRWAV